MGFPFCENKDFISSSEIALSHLTLSKKILAQKIQIDTPKNDNVCISNALFNIYKPIELYINNSVQKETISHLTMDINLTFYAIFTSQTFQEHR